jgi:hypothetical protein
MRAALLMAWVLLGGIANPVAAATGDGAALRPASSDGIPYRKSEEGADAGTLLRVVSGLGAVLLVGAGAIYLMKKYLPGAYGVGAAGAHKIRLVEVRRLTPRLTLFAVEYQGRQLLLAHSGDQVTTVADMGVAVTVDVAEQQGAAPHA